MNLHIAPDDSVYVYNPLDVSNKTERLVVANGNRRKYYRFRPAGFYGGIATADAVGCNLRCVFCWSGASVWNTEKTGALYTPEQVVQNLHAIAEKKGYHKVRISGGEPTIGRDHLCALLRLIHQDYEFILETNGILLGADREYVKTLSGFPNLHVRVCLKGCDNEEFSWLTGAETGFDYQLKALEHLRDLGMKFNIALVSVKPDKHELFDLLHEMGLENIMIEDEEITLYPAVTRRLKKAGILGYFERGRNNGPV